jgi:hypothetical protein
MMRSIMLLLVLFPCFAFAQATKEDYGIYSQYLKEFRIESKTQINFVVRKSSADSTKYDYFAADIPGDIRKFLNGETASLPDFEHLFRDFTTTLIKDTSWVSLLAELNQKIKQKIEIENDFSPDLKTVIINDSIYEKYFKNVRSYKRIVKNWAHFHKQYPDPSALIAFSEIASDGERAIFYFTARRNVLIGEGDLVFFHKENNEWKYLYSAALWYN